MPFTKVTTKITYRSTVTERTNSPTGPNCLLKSRGSNEEMVSQSLGEIATNNSTNRQTRNVTLRDRRKPLHDGCCFPKKLSSIAMNVTGQFTVSSATIP